MQKTNPTPYTLETLCAAIGGRLGMPLADQVRVQSQIADRGLGITYVLETDRAQTPPFRLTTSVERPATNQREEPGQMPLDEAAEWLACELMPAPAAGPQKRRLPICMSDGLPVPELQRAEE